MKGFGILGVVALGVTATAIFVLTNYTKGPDAKASVLAPIESAPGEFEGFVVADGEELAPGAPAAAEQGRPLPDGMEWLTEQPPAETQAVGLKTEEGVFVGVVLPYDTREGDTVSTVVMASPPVDRGPETLEGMVVVDPQGEEHEVKAGDVITFAAAATMVWKLLDSDGETIVTHEVELEESPSPRGEGFQEEPIVVRNNQVIDIPGEFNGDMSDTSIKFGGQNAVVIAENPRGTIIAAPNMGTQVGAVPVEVTDGDNVTELQAVYIDIDLEGPRQMTIGQKAEMQVTVNGLGGISEEDKESMEEAIWIQYINEIPGTIELSEGPAGAHSVNLEDIDDGTYSFSVEFTAIEVGAYRIAVWPHSLLEASVGTYCTARQCCVLTCQTCTGRWFCGDEGIVSCARLKGRNGREKAQCGKCKALGCTHGGGSACGHWWCECKWGACLC